MDPVNPTVPSRREFLAAATTTAVAAAVTAQFPSIAEGASPLTLAPLPFADDALAPVISRNTLSFHYGKHHKAYVDKTNELIAGSPLADMKLEEIVKAAAGDPKKAALFNNAAQAWNHAFYWKSLSPKGGGKPAGKMAEKVDASFGSYEAFRKELVDACMGQFGSGWAWVVSDGGKLKVARTPNAETPLTTAATPILTIDVWEHAYYLDWQNKRKDYAEAVVDKLLNWEFAAQNLGI
jgi:Fe-Mn family superoxide dismutase